MTNCGYCTNQAVTWIGKLDENAEMWLFEGNLCEHHYNFFCDIMRAENIYVQDWDFESTT